MNPDDPGWPSRLAIALGALMVLVAAGLAAVIATAATAVVGRFS